MDTKWKKSKTKKTWQVIGQKLKFAKNMVVKTCVFSASEVFFCVLLFSYLQESMVVPLSAFIICDSHICSGI